MMSQLQRNGCPRFKRIGESTICRADPIFALTKVRRICRVQGPVAALPWKSVKAEVDIAVYLRAGPGKADIDRLLKGK